MAEDEELVAMKANLYEERACRKEGEENLVASKANAADQHRHGDKAVLKAGEMEEKVEMLMSEVEAMRGSWRRSEQSSMPQRDRSWQPSECSTKSFLRKYRCRHLQPLKSPTPAWDTNATASAGDSAIPAIPAPAVSAPAIAEVGPAAPIFTISRRTYFVTSRSENPPRPPQPLHPPRHQLPRHCVLFDVFQDSGNSIRAY